MVRPSFACFSTNLGYKGMFNLAYILQKKNCHPSSCIFAVFYYVFMQWFDYFFLPGK